MHKYLIAVIILIIGIFVGMNVNVDGSSGNSALTLFSKPSEEVLIKNKIIKSFSGFVRSTPLMQIESLVNDGVLLPITSDIDRRIAIYTQNIVNGEPPAGSTNKPFVVCENQGGPGPAGFSGPYSGSSPAGSTFISYMGGLGGTPFLCTVY